MPRTLSEQEYQSVLNRVLSSAPEGLDEASFNRLLDNEVSKAEASGGSSLAKTVTSSLPTAMGMAGSLIGGSKASPVGMALAGVGGAAGEAYRQVADSLRGDFSNVPDTVGGRLMQIGTEGAKQAGLEGGGRVLGAGLKAIAAPIYKAAIPKAIQDKFGDAALAAEGLANKVWLGTKGGKTAASEVKSVGVKAMQDAAPSVPSMTARDVQSAFVPKYNKALLGRDSAGAQDINDYVANAMSEIGTSPMSGAEQLARKESKERIGKSAMNAANANLAATNPQLANIERAALVKNLRQSPQMAEALNKTQAGIGLSRAAKATENSSLLNRLRHGGVWNALQSPMGMSGAGIALDTTGNNMANILRAAILSQLGSQE